MDIIYGICRFLTEQWIWATVILCIWNIAVFALYGADKARAKTRRRRVPESVLLWTAFLFGSVGATAGIFLFRHKTNHIKFILLVPFFMVLHMIGLGLVCHFAAGA